MYIFQGSRKQIQEDQTLFVKGKIHLFIFFFLQALKNTNLFFYGFYSPVENKKLTFISSGNTYSLIFIIKFSSGNGGVSTGDLYSLAGKRNHAYTC